MNLLEKEPINPSLWQDLIENLVRIDSADSDLCETITTYDDCIKAINNMQDFKSPCCDGLPAEFYKKISIGENFVNILNSQVHTLSDTQRIGITTLLRKDVSKADDLGAWRPISTHTIKSFLKQY